MKSLPGAVGSALLLLISAAGCDTTTAPPLVASDIRAFASLPGSDAAVLYLTLHNRSRDAVTIERIGSPEFARVEMHETVLQDGVASMQPLDGLSIPAGGSVEFKMGGKHVMLTGGDSAPGSPVTIIFEYPGGALEIGTSLRDRFESS